MPIYEMRCEGCGEAYDVWSSMSKKEESVGSAVCPSCGSSEKEEIVGCPSVNFTNPVGTDRWNSESRGHDYRFKHNMDKPDGTLEGGCRAVQEDRRHLQWQALRRGQMRC